MDTVLQKQFGHSLQWMLFTTCDNDAPSNHGESNEADTLSGSYYKAERLRATVAHSETVLRHTNIQHGRTQARAGSKVRL